MKARNAFHSQTSPAVRGTISNRKDQLGFGALEVMIALVIGAIVILGAVFWYPKLMNSSNNGDELQNVSTLVSNTRQLKTASGYGATGTNLVPTLITAGGIPDGMQKTATTVFNAWDGAVTIASTGTGFSLTYAGVPAENCVFLATKGAGSSSLSTKLNSGSAITGEVTAAAASAGCSTATNSITWSGR
jgi:type II secretory pathway pseudopilin PulG